MISSNALRFILIVLIIVVSVDSHCYLSSFIINGKDQGNDNCLRPQYVTAQPPMYRDSPIMDKKTLTRGILSENLTCGFLPFAKQPANRKCAVNAGDTVGLQWWHAYPNDDVLDPSHVGPTMAYMARSDDGSGSVWFKVYEDGFDTTANNWATDKMISNRGVYSFKIPSDIAPGNYLLRGEVIALHEGFAVGGAQPYVGCVEITVSGSGTAAPDTVAIPGVYNLTSPGVLFDVYSGKNAQYPIPGPRAYKEGTATNHAGDVADGVTASSSSSGISSGAVAAIVIVIIAVVVASIVVGLLALKKFKPLTFYSVTDPVTRAFQAVKEKTVGV